MHCPEHIFRKYDIRGKADIDLTDEVVESIGKAFGTYLFSPPNPVGESVLRLYNQVRGLNTHETLQRRIQGANP